MAKRYKEDEVETNKQNNKKQTNKAPLQTINKKGKRTKEDELRKQKEIEKQIEKEKKEKEKLEQQKKKEHEDRIKKQEKERAKKREAQEKLREKSIKEQEKETEKQKKQKEIQRNKRIKQINNEKKNSSGFDKDTEMVIEMTNKNKKTPTKQSTQKSKQQIKIEKKKKRIIRIIKLILLLVVIIGLAIFAMTSPIFNIKDIQVLNNEQVSSDEVISLSGLNKDENIFKFLQIDVKNSVKQNPYIEDVKVHRKIPNVVQIEVSERTKKFAVQMTTTFAYINSQGYILGLDQDRLGLPALTGLKTLEENIIPGNRLENNDLKKLEDAIKIIDVCKDNDIDSQVTSIDMTNENDYIIYMEAENKKIYVGDSTNLSNKIIYAKAILTETQDKEGEVFVNGDLNGKFKPYFREKVQY